MKMMPLGWRIAFNLVLFSLLLLSQWYWFARSRGWLLRGSARKRAKTLRLCVHALVFVGLIAGIAIAIRSAWPFPWNYRVSALRWWFDGLMGVYFVGSFVSGLGLLAWQIATSAFRRRRPQPQPDPVAQPVLSGAAPQPLEADPPATLVLPARPDLLHPTRRRFLSTTGGLVAVSPFAYALYGLVGERLDFQTTHIKLPMGPAGAALRGRTIAQISDIHISPYLTAHDLHRVVDMVNALNADLVVVTGDFVTFAGDSQYDCVRELARLRARTGMLGCLGNHEIYTHTEDSITRLCGQRGIDILRFEGRRIPLGQGFLNIAGVDFLRPGEEHRVQEVRPWMKEGEANLLLSHNPNAFNALGDMPVQATLAGHTHGGQMRVEFVDIDLTPARLITPYIAGMYRHRNQLLYVNRGIGTVGMPIRIGATPEITLYELA